MGRMALLRHDLAGGEWHYDWLLEPEDAPDGADARVLIAFRLHRRPDAAGLNAGEGLPAERLAEHRRRYLDYEGKISGDRGRVVRLASGTCRVTHATADRVEFTCDWGRGEVRWRAEPAPPDQWRLIIIEASPGR